MLGSAVAGIGLILPVTDSRITRVATSPDEP